MRGDVMWYRIILVKLLLLTVLHITGIKAQQTEHRVTGTVMDQSGETFPGTTVIVKGTVQGTVTDMDGRYVIAVPKDAILQFSFVGMENREIAVEGRQRIDVVMEDNISEGIMPAKPILLTPKQREKAEADNRFSFNVFLEISRLQGPNAFFSPISLNMALGTLYNGSSGDTRTEMNQIWGITNFSESELNDYYRTINRRLLEADRFTDIAIANSIWYRSDFSMKEAFKETSKRYFDTDIKALDFNDSNAANVINKWCLDKTNGKINHIAATPMPGDMMMYLANAIYFKSKWQMEKRFRKEQTKPDDFIQSDGKTLRVEMMEQTTSLPYYSDSYLQCVELPYGNGAYSMMAVLPPDNENISQLIEYLSSAHWERIVNQMKSERVWLKLPRLRIECNIPFNQPLKNVGMQKIFSGGFAHLSDDAFNVSNIRQKAFIEVNEEGTEVAAVTSMMIVGYGVMKTSNEPVHFFANRPFMLLIREKSTGVILFIGRIDDPRS
ncbi:MAG: carboxypeptidase-like regulatory domain-containing protein [Porphyromonadaceae bacterium]|nr:carboxypeptidase-like regulatory domain-containing protein [Porphyromonadaceae bacterium]